MFASISVVRKFAQRTPLLIAATALLFSGALAQRANADEPWQGVAEAARRAAFRPLEGQRVAEARAELLERLSQIDDSTRGKHGAIWKQWQTYLRWDELMAAAESDPPDLPKLQNRLSAFYGAVPGIEHPRLLAVREALARYVEAAQALAEPATEDAFRERQARLVELLESREPARHDAIGRHLAWLKWNDQAPELREQAAAAASYPNFVVGFNKANVRRALDDMRQRFEDRRNASNIIAGARVTGPVHVQGIIQPTLQREAGDAEKPALALVLHTSGVMNSPRNTAVAGPLQLTTRGETSIEARTRITWDGEKLVCEPTDARCQTRTTTIASQLQRRRLFGAEGGLIDQVILNAAEGQAEQRRAQAEAESSRIAERQISAQLDARLSKFVATANGYIDQFYHKPLTRVGMRCRATFLDLGNYVGLGLTKRDGADLAAHSPADFSQLDGDVVVGLHESALTSFTHRLCGGATFKDEDFAALQRKMIGDQDYELRIGEHPRWSVVMDSLQPMATRFQENSIQFIFRCQSVQVKERRFAEPFAVTVEYQLQPSRSTLHLVRTADVQIHWKDAPQGHELRPRLEKFLLRKFGGFFLDDMYLDGLTFPAGGQWQAITGLRFQEVHHDGDWLYLVARNTDPTQLAARE